MTVETEIRRQHESAAVIRVISHEEIGHRSLRRRRLQRWVRIDDARRGKESGIRDSPDAGIAVIVRNVLEQPVDRVVEIAAVVHILLGFLVVDVRPHLDERSLRHITPSDILKDENVSRFIEFGGRPKLRSVKVDAVGADAVRSAIDQKWIRARSVLRNIHRGEEVNAVPHRDPVFVLGVVLFYVELRRFRPGLRETDMSQSPRAQSENQKASSYHFLSIDQ